MQVASGEPFNSSDYMAPTPAWAVYGAVEGGFDPQQARFRKERNHKSNRQSTTWFGCYRYLIDKWVIEDMEVLGSHQSLIWTKFSSTGIMGKQIGLLLCSIEVLVLLSDNIAIWHQNNFRYHHIRWFEGSDFIDVL